MEIVKTEWRVDEANRVIYKVGYDVNGERYLLPDENSKKIMSSGFQVTNLDPVVVGEGTEEEMKRLLEEESKKQSCPTFFGGYK